jgi:hypothetical protein
MGTLIRTLFSKVTEVIVILRIHMLKQLPITLLNFIFIKKVYWIFMLKLR